MVERTGEAQEASPVAGVEAVIGGPEGARHLRTGETDGCGLLPDAAQAGRGIAAGRQGTGPEAENEDDDDADDEEDDGGVVAGLPGDGVTSSPSCDPWTFLGGAAGNGGPAFVWIAE